MPDSLLLDIRLKKSQLIEQAVATWHTNEKIGHNRETLILGLEDAIAECLRFPAEMKVAWNSLVKKMAVTRLPYSPEDRNKLRETFDRVIAVTVHVLDEAQQVEQQLGAPVAGAAELPGAVNQLHKLRDQVLDRWPQHDPATYEQAMADYQAGRHRSAQELYDELRRSHS